MVLKQREENHFSFKALKAVIYAFFFRFENAISNTLYHSILFYLMTFMSKIQESDNTHIAANKICCSISDCLYCLMTDENFALLCAVEFWCIAMHRRIELNRIVTWWIVIESNREGSANAHPYKKVSKSLAKRQFTYRVFFALKFTQM